MDGEVGAGTITSKYGTAMKVFIGGTV